MFLALDDSDNLRGFLGTLPDRWQLQGRTLTIAWLSCLWVDPACRGQGIAGALLRQAHEAWEGMLALTEFTPAAKALYDRSGLFVLLPARTGWRAYRRPDVQGTVLRRWPKLQPIAPVLRGLDALGEGLLSLSDHPAPLPDSGSISLGGTLFEPWQQEALSTETGLHQALDKRVQDDPLSPTLSLILSRLQWIHEHPWLKQAAPDDGARRYPFSSVSAQFQTWLWLVKHIDGEFAGVVSMSLRDGVLKIPYCLVPDSALTDVLMLARSLMNKHEAHTLVTHQQKLVNMLHQNRKGFVHLRPSTRYYMLSKGLAAHWDAAQADIALAQDGAGDAAFT